MKCFSELTAQKTEHNHENKVEKFLQISTLLL